MQEAADCEEMEIPSKSIDFVNEEENIVKSTEFSGEKTPEIKSAVSFSPIKFVGVNDEIVDEEITIMARKDKEELGQCERVTVEGVHGSISEISTRLQRKSDEEIFNTPKRERNFEDFNLNIRNRSKEVEVTESEDNGPLKTPQKIMGHLVKSLSTEFEERLASIKVSPKIQSVAPRNMSPVRCIAELSPVSKLNLNERSNFEIEEPKLVSPSKIAAVTLGNEIEKVRIELESKVKKDEDLLYNRLYFLYFYFWCSGRNRSSFYNSKSPVWKRSTTNP